MKCYVVCNQMGGTKRGHNWSRRDVTIEMLHHRLVLKLWGEKITLAENLLIGDRIKIKNVVTEIFATRVSVSSTDETEIQVKFNPYSFTTTKNYNISYHKPAR